MATGQISPSSNLGDLGMAEAVVFNRPAPTKLEVNMNQRLAGVRASSFLAVMLRHGTMPAAHINHAKEIVQAGIDSGLISAVMR